MKIKNQNNTGSDQVIKNTEIHNHPQEGPKKNNCDLNEEGQVNVWRTVTRKEQNKYNLQAVGAVFLPALGLWATILQIMPFVTSMLVFIPLVLVAISFFCIVHHDNFKIATSSLPKEGELNRLYDNKLWTIGDNGDYVIFTITAPCFRDGCDGKIVICSPPKKYNGEFSFAAKCSKAGKQHSYTIDYNMIATPTRLDWSPIPPQNQPQHG